LGRSTVYPSPRFLGHRISTTERLYNQTCMYLTFSWTPMQVYDRNTGCDTTIFVVNGVNRGDLKVARLPYWKWGIDWRHCGRTFASYCKITQRLFAACQLKLAVS
jgi:hypothetical protein